MADSFTGLYYGFPSNKPEKSSSGVRRSGFAASRQLERDLDGELNLACGCGGLGQDAGGAQRPCAIENVRVVGSDRWSKVGMIEDVKHLSSKLQVEIL